MVGDPSAGGTVAGAAGGGGWNVRLAPAMVAEPENPTPTDPEVPALTVTTPGWTRTVLARNNDRPGAVTVTSSLCARNDPGAEVPSVVVDDLAGGRQHQRPRQLHRAQGGHRRCGLDRAAEPFRVTRLSSPAPGTGDVGTEVGTVAGSTWDRKQKNIGQVADVFRRPGRDIFIMRRSRT